MERSVVAIGDCDLDVGKTGAGPPIVVLHGEDGTLFCDAFIERLGRSFEVHVPHHPAWGRSTQPRHVSTTRDVALIQQEYVERFGRPVPLVGLSFGGWVAAEIAANAPALVSALVLVSPTGIKAAGRTDREFVDIYVTATGERRGVYYAPASAPKLSERPGVDVFFESAKAEEAVARYCWQPYMHDPGLAHRLRRITAPALIVSGTADSFVLDPEHYFKTYAHLIGSRAGQERISGAGHRVEEERPGEVAAAVDGFVARHAVAPAGR